MPTIFFTGFPGFLGSQLLPRVLARRPEASATCLVQDKFVSMAEGRREELVRAHPGLDGRIELAVGDITLPDLGLGKALKLRDETVEVYHLAAVYNLSVARPLGMKVNVEGTRHVLDFAADCRQLSRFQYVSTCYVSGRYCGIFTEEDLDKGQRFNNYYEETKFLAEVEVQARMREGLPATIYRPGIVTGDSHTGETQKFDGPYFILQWLLRQPRQLAVLPLVGDPSMVRVNLVPRDFVTDAIAHLSGLEESKGLVYHLADPEPLTADRLIEESGRATGRRIFRIPLPLTLAKLSIERVPGVYSLLRIPADVVDYFVHPTHYTTANATRDLAPAGIVCPHLPNYIDRLVDFLRRNPNACQGTMV